MKPEIILQTLKLARKACCGYMGDTYCDCKYGASGSGEQTGCPELREMIRAMEILIDETETKSVD